MKEFPFFLNSLKETQNIYFETRRREKMNRVRENRLKKKMIHRELMTHT